MEYFEFEMFVGNSQSEMHRTFITTYPLGKRWPACDSDFRFPGVLATRAIGLQKLFDYRLMSKRQPCKLATAVNSLLPTSS